MSYRAPKAGALRPDGLNDYTTGVFGTARCGVGEQNLGRYGGKGPLSNPTIQQLLYLDARRRAA